MDKLSPISKNKSEEEKEDFIIQSPKEISVINGTKWNRQTEKITLDIAKMSSEYKYEHLEMARVYNKKYNFIMVIALFLSPLAGCISTFSAFTIP